MAPPVTTRRLDDSPLDDLGMSQEEFAELALNGPLDWDGEQLDHLQTILEGDPLEPEVLRELVEDYMYHDPKEPTPPVRQLRPKETGLELDPEELAESQAIAGGQPVQYSPPSQLEVPSRIDIDSWLKKK